MINKDEWLEMRKNKIGASDAPVIMNMSPWKTPFKLWQEKVGVSVAPYINASMKRGLSLEDEALKTFESMTGYVMLPQVVMQHPTIDWMMATMDGITVDKSMGVEIKCSGKTDHELAKNDRIPDKYVPQLQHQMVVCGWDSMYYFSYHNSEGVVVQVKRDNAFIERMLQEEEEFWQHVLEFSPPEKTDKDSPKQYVVRDDDAWAFLCQETLKVRRQLRYLKEQEELLIEQVKVLSEGCEVSGGGVTFSKRTRVGPVEYKNIPQLQGVDLDAYRKPPTEYWTLEEDG